MTKNNKFTPRDAVLDPFGNPIRGNNIIEAVSGKNPPDWYTPLEPVEDKLVPGTPDLDKFFDALEADAKRFKPGRPAQKVAFLAGLATKKWSKYRVEPYDPDAIDGDNDGIVQEGTVWERPAGARILDKAGKELQAGLLRRNPSSDWQIVDSDGNAISYTPKAPSPSAPKKGTIGDISRAATVGEPIGGTSKPAKKGVKKVAVKKSEAQKEVDKPHTLEERGDAVNNWVSGNMRKLRTFVTDILNGSGNSDEKQREVLGPLASLGGGAGDVMWENYLRHRRRTAILMNAVADGQERNFPLYRGEYSELGGRELLDILAPGTEYGLPLRSFTEDDNTSSGIVSNFLEPHGTQRRDGTRIVIIMEPGAVSADVRDLAQSIQDEHDERDPQLVKERAGEGVRFSQSEARAFPFGGAEYELIDSELEHLVMGNAEIVSAEWQSPMGQTLDEVKDDRNGTIVLKIRQTESLGKPEVGKVWR